MLGIVLKQTEETFLGAIHRERAFSAQEFYLSGSGMDKDSFHLYGLHALTLYLSQDMIASFR